MYLLIHLDRKISVFGAEWVKYLIKLSGIEQRQFLKQLEDKKKREELKKEKRRIKKRKETSPSADMVRLLG